MCILRTVDACSVRVSASRPRLDLDQAWHRAAPLKHGRITDTNSGSAGESPCALRAYTYDDQGTALASKQGGDLGPRLTPCRRPIVGAQSLDAARVRLALLATAGSSEMC